MDNGTEMRRYEVAGKFVVWEWNDRIAELPPCNLYILSPDGTTLWTMQDAMKHEDCCVSLRTDGDSIHFITFNGFSVTFDVRSMTVTAKAITK